MSKDEKKKEDKLAEKVYRRHKRLWSFLWHTLGWVFKKIYGYECVKVPKDLKPPYLVMANHNADLDPVLVALTFPKQMYIVASEHIYRRGFVSKLLKWAFEPIAKIKGSSDTLTVMKMIRCLRSGKNVLIFPEGNRSFHGVTGPINDATGKLVKASAATLVTYKLTGGYLTNPRWGYGIRKGKMRGEIVKIYSPEQIKEMSTEEVTDIIRKDLYEDAYERQKEWNIAYKGKDRALGLEGSYCVCPDCKEVGTIATKGNSVFCTKCGKTTEFTEYGYFTDGFNFKTTYEWDCWQQKFYKDFVQKQEGLYFADKNLILRTVGSDHQEVIIGIGEFAMSKEKFIFTHDGETLEIEVMQVPDMSIYGKCGLMFTDSTGTHYELLPAEKGQIYNARKYLSCWEIIRNS